MCFYWMFCCCFQSCSCRPQQISAQMGLIGTRCRGATTAEAVDKIWPWGIDMVGDVGGAGSVFQGCRLTFEASRPSSPRQPCSRQTAATRQSLGGTSASSRPTTKLFRLPNSSFSQPRQPKPTVFGPPRSYLLHGPDSKEASLISSLSRWRVCLPSTAAAAPSSTCCPIANIGPQATLVTTGTSPSSRNKEDCSKSVRSNATYICNYEGQRWWWQPPRWAERVVARIGCGAEEL